MAHTSVETMAKHLISELRQVRPSGPYYLMGYSFGGIVAYEMAQQLTAAREEVPLLALLDTYAPGLYATAREQEKKFYEPLKSAVFRWLISRKLRAGERVPVRLRNFHIIDTYDRAALAYAAKPYAGRLTMMKAIGSWGADEMGWSALAKGGLDVVRVPGDHYSMISEPQVARVATYLDERMLALEAERAIARS